MNDSLEPRRQARGLRRREQLLDVAAARLLAGGIEDLTMEGIAADAGVNKALPYYHFESRDNLLATLYRREFERLAADVVGDLDLDAPLPDVLSSMLGAWIAGADHQSVIGLLDSVRTESGALETEVLQWRTAVVGLVADVIGRNEPMAPDEARFTASVVLASLQALLGSQRVVRWSHERIVRWFVAMVIGAIDAAASASRPAPSTRTPERDGGVE